MSELKVNKVSPQSGTDFTLGDSGDTFTVPSGATLTVAGTFTQTGAQTFDGGVDIDNFNINGSEIDLSSGDLTVDVAGDIILDADGGEVLFHDATTAMGHISMASSNITLKSLVSDKDIIFQGNDGGAGITALTLDMSAAGAATFNNKIIATELDISGNCDIDGTTNLDAVDIDGAVQLDATLTIGANDQGYDVILYGDTASANVTWDTSADDLIFNGAAGLIVPDGQLTLGSTAVTATAAELNLIDGGTSRGTTAIADGDGVLINDAGTMRQTTVETLKTYIGGAQGITSTDQYRLTADLTNPGTADITANLERVDDATFGRIGTGMSVTDGIYTFPSTGIWRVQAIIHFYIPSGNDGAAVVNTMVSSNAGTAYDGVASAIAGSTAGGQLYNTHSSECFIDVTNTSNYRVKFRTDSMAATKAVGSTNENQTSFSFMRLGDT